MLHLNSRGCRESVASQPMVHDCRFATSLVHKAPQTMRVFNPREAPAGASPAGRRNRRRNSSEITVPNQLRLPTLDMTV